MSPNGNKMIEEPTLKNLTSKNYGQPSDKENEVNTFEYINKEPINNLTS